MPSSNKMAASLQLGLLLATDWLLGVRVLLWETRGSQGVRIGYYQDLETLTKLVKLLPAGVSQVHTVPPTVPPHTVPPYYTPTLYPPTLYLPPDASTVVAYVQGVLSVVGWS